MITRRAHGEDLDKLSKLFDQYRVFYKQDSDLAAAKRFISERIETEDSVIFVIELEDELVGFTQLYPSFSSVGMQKIYILNDLYVAKKYRKKGVAKNLMNHAKEFTRSQNRSKLVLETGHDNLQAQNLYDQLGYTQDKVYVYELKV